jgi:hypothetical protein
LSADLIASREPVSNDTVWMVTSDERGLGLESCRCGQSVVAALTKFHGPTIELEFTHEQGVCRAAFSRDKFQPLSWVEYRQLMGLETESDDA